MMEIFNALGNLLQLLGGLMMTVGYMPQIRQIWKTKSAGDLNMKTQVMVFIGISCFEFNAVKILLSGADTTYFATNTLSLLIAAAMCLLVKRYGGAKEAETANETIETKAA